MPERFIFGYEIPDKYGITLADVIAAIRQERLQPYHPVTQTRLPAPSVKKRVRRFSSDEIGEACMKENGKRREQGQGPLIPMTQQYEAFLDECWHTEDSYSWKHLKDSQADEVKQWCFCVEELDDLFKLPWLTGKKLVEPDWNLTEETLLAHVLAGRLVPYECFQRFAHPVEEPCGTRRLMPTEELRERYEELTRKQLDAGLLRERLSRTDEEFISSRLENFKLPDGASESDERTRLEQLLPQRRSEWEQKLALIEAEIRDLEAALHPGKAWKGLGTITPSEQDEIFEKLLTARFQRKEVDRLLLGAPTVHGNNRRDAVNPSATTQTGLVTWQDLIQRYPLFVLFKAMRDGRLKPLHPQTGAALSLPWDLLEYFAIFKNTENPEKDKEVLRRLGELVDSEPLLNDLPPDKLNEEYSRLENAVFSASELDHALSREPSGDDEKTAESEQTVNALPCNDGTTWEQITFVLKSDELVYVKTPNREARLHYSKLGFVDNRKGDSPNITTWPLFQALARMNGEITLKGDEYLRHLPDNARLLNKHLKSLFGIQESIWVSHYRKSKSYKARFTIRDERTE